jgi:hypothetical protein
MEKTSLILQPSGLKPAKRYLQPAAIRTFDVPKVYRYDD